MSCYDTEEAYYCHCVLPALLSINSVFCVTSNRESRKGRFDLQRAERIRQSNAFILEIKASGITQFIANDAERDTRQAKTKKYALEAANDGCKGVKIYETASSEGLSHLRRGKPGVL